MVKALSSGGLYASCAADLSPISSPFPILQGTSSSANSSDSNESSLHHHSHQSCSSGLSGGSSSGIGGSGNASFTNPSLIIPQGQKMPAQSHGFTQLTRLELYRAQLARLPTYREHYDSPAMGNPGFTRKGGDGRPFGSVQDMMINCDRGGGAGGKKGIHSSHTELVISYTEEGAVIMNNTDTCLEGRLSPLSPSESGVSSSSPYAISVIPKRPYSIAEYPELDRECIQSRELQLKVKRPLESKAKNNVTIEGFNSTNQPALHHNSNHSRPSPSVTPHSTSHHLHNRPGYPAPPPPSVQLSHPSSPGHLPPNHRVTDAYLVSVDRSQQHALQTRLQQAHPGIRTVDMTEQYSDSPVSSVGSDLSAVAAATHNSGIGGPGGLIGSSNHSGLNESDPIPYANQTRIGNGHVRFMTNDHQPMEEEFNHQQPITSKVIPGAQPWYKCDQNMAETSFITAGPGDLTDGGAKSEDAHLVQRNDRSSSNNSTPQVHIQPQRQQPTSGMPLPTIIPPKLRDPDPNHHHSSGDVNDNSNKVTIPNGHSTNNNNNNNNSNNNSIIDSNNSNHNNVHNGDNRLNGSGIMNNYHQQPITSLNKMPITHLGTNYNNPQLSSTNGEPAVIEPASRIVPEVKLTNGNGISYDLTNLHIHGNSKGSNSGNNGNTTRVAPLTNGVSGNNDPERVEQLRRYEEDLRHRRESQDKLASEQEFLRSSLRGSKKLQALAKAQPSPAPSHSSQGGHVNQAFSPTEMGLHHHQTGGDKPVVLEDVMLSVNRVTEALNRFPEHRRDAAFLRDLFSSRDVHQAVGITAAVQEQLGRMKLTGGPQTTEAFALADLALKVLAENRSCGSMKSKELQVLLESPHIQALLYSHDKIAHKLQETCPHATGEVWGLKETSLDHREESCDLRIIRLARDGDMPLGATVKCEGGTIAIGRIVKGGVAEKSGLLHEGDEILEVNGVDIRGKTIAEVCDMMSSITGVMSFVVASRVAVEESPESKMAINSVKYFRALFHYDPEDDIYLPCRELGLRFDKGDILHVISMQDDRWWQAYRDGEDNPLAGLIPSAEFQEQREQYARNMLLENQKDSVGKTGLFCYKGGGKVKKNKTVEVPIEPVPDEFDEILSYEEVSLYMSRSGRKRPIVLVGPPNVGCLELRQRLMEADKERFAGVVPHTSRAKRPGEQDGVHYWFVNKSDFQGDVQEGKFVEWGEYQKHFYGTSVQAIKNVINRGQTCVLTLRPQSLRTLRMSGVMPYIVFISPPSLERFKINRQKNGQVPVKDEDLKTIISEARTTFEKFGHYFDKEIVNHDLERTFQELRLSIHRLETEPQFVPTAWLHAIGDGENTISSLSNSTHQQRFVA